MVGGATESLNVGGKDKVKLYLVRRKGFVKLALQHGRDLVPVFGFGENEIYDQVDNPKGSRIRRFQERMKDLTSFTLPLFHGRGIFQYDYGLVPFREANSMEFIFKQANMALYFMKSKSAVQGNSRNGIALALYIHISCMPYF